VCFFLQLLQQAITMRQDFIEAYINLGDILVKLDRVQDAQRTYEQAIQVDPRNADLHFNLGVVHLEQKHTPEARRCFEKALEINPDHTVSVGTTECIFQLLKLTFYRITSSSSSSSSSSLFLLSLSSF
jgi:tetratricopeptide (TPR) repeat protein